MIRVRKNQVAGKKSESTDQMKKQHQNQRPKGGPAPQKSPSQPAQRARGGPPLQAQKTKPPPQPVQEPREPKETNLAKLLVECAEEEDLGLFELSHVYAHLSKIVSPIS